MPLCMRNLAQKLNEVHHLRHAGRIQYGLFLKGIGLGLEEALVYWASEFSKVGCDPFSPTPTTPPPPALVPPTYRFQVFVC
jgi:DNA primase large subunit